MMKSEIKAVVFDIGGVLEKGSEIEHYSPLCKALKIDLELFHKIRKKYLKKARIGKLSTKQYLLSISKEIGIEYKDLFRKWIKYKRKAFKKNRGVESIIRRLKKHGYKVGSLTNIIEIHHKIRHENKIYDIFDFNICSFMIGIDKPKSRIYKLLIKKLEAKPEEIVFIDDYDEYLEPAKKVGMHTILFKNHKQLIKELKKLRLLV